MVAWFKVEAIKIRSRGISEVCSQPNRGGLLTEVIKGRGREEGANSVPHTSWDKGYRNTKKQAFMLINYVEPLEFDRAVIHPRKATHDAVSNTGRG